MTIDPDRLANVTANGAARAAVRTVDVLQDLSEDQRVVGIAAAFVLTCTAYGVNRNDMMRIADRIVTFFGDTTYKPEFRAILEYMKNGGK